MTTEEQLEQAREVVKLLEKKCDTNGYVGVEIENPFDNLKRYTRDYTILHCIFENILDEIFVLTENLKYEEELDGLTRFEAKRHIKKLKKFINDNSKKYFKGTEVYEYIKKAESIE